MLIAPIPGAKPDPQQPSMLLSAPDMKPSDATASIVSGASGPKAGNGTAKLDNTPTATQKANKSAVVEAKPNSEGPSSRRNIEGGIRTEAAARTANTTTLDLIKEQEAALDDSALPPARREQVRRYFNELRKRFESK